MQLDALDTLATVEKLLLDFQLHLQVLFLSQKIIFIKGAFSCLNNSLISTYRGQ